MKQGLTKNITLAAMFFAVGLLLPLLTGQIQQFGNMLLPMHIPVLLCGLICGPAFGAAAGFLLPLVRFMIFGMPPVFPTGIAMAFELMTYGFVVGLIYRRSRWQCVISLYRAMIAAMLAGRAVWGAVMLLVLGLGDGGFSLQMFMAGAFLNALPGIALQLTLIPAIMIALNRTGLVRFRREHIVKPETPGTT